MSPRIEEPLASAVREAGWTTLAPEADLTPVGPPVLRDSLHLGGDLWLVVVGAHDGSVRGVPVVHAEGKVRRAEPGDGAAQALVEVIRLGRATGAFTVTPWHVDPVVGETSLGERVLVGGAAVVRWADEADSRPAMDLMRRLVRSGFAGMPRPWGVLGWQPPAEVAPRLLAQVEAYVPGAVDGCDWAVHDLREALVADDLGGLHRSGTSLGELLAGFHLALASTAGPSTAEDVDRWRDAGQRDLDDALAATHSAYAPGSGEAYGLLRRREQQLRSLLALPEVVPGPPLMLTHGDLHVGRVLRAGHTLRITVDGAAADAPAPAADDVAALAQSLVTAGFSLRDEHAPDLVAQASRAFVAAFLTAYGVVLADDSAPDLLDDELLHPLRVRQVLRALSRATSDRETQALSDALTDLL